MLVNPDDKIARSPEQFLRLDIINDKMIQMKNDDLRNYAKIAIDEKFKNINFQNVLISTGNRPILWNDLLDNVLGVGPNGRGENFVGKYLVSKRNEINKNTPVYKVNEKNIITLLNTDTFLFDWVVMRSARHV